jgi:hypothetical protein
MAITSADGTSRCRRALRLPDAGYCREMDGDWDPQRELADELRAEAEEDERLAALDRMRRRGLAEVALELLHRGDTVAVTAAGRTFTGPVVYAARDLVTVQTAAGPVDVQLGVAVLRVVERSRSGGLERGRGAPSFTARLHEHQAAGGPVVVGVTGLADDLVCRLTAVATDHVVLDPAGGLPWYVPLAEVAYIAFPA